ncbi:MAG: molybdopterin-dependent oxidoreductase, partial [Acidiferrobacterales bacterium]
MGSNLDIQSRRHEVMRVLPRENQAINECWLSDRDRFSYLGLNGPERLLVPMIRTDGRWVEVDWNTALGFSAAGLRKAIDTHGSDQLGALAAPGCTVEELYLLQRLIRSLGSGNVDHRLRQIDFSDDDALPPFPWLGQAIAALDDLDAALLVGSNIRKDQPILGHRLRKAAGKGAQIMTINPVDYDFAFELAYKIIADPGAMISALAGVAKALTARGKHARRSLPGWFNGLMPGEREQAIAEVLVSAGRATVLLGSFALSHPKAAALRAIAGLVGELAGAQLGYLADANSAGAWLAGCVPHRGAAGGTATQGRDAYAMMQKPLKAYVLLGVEPELDCLEGAHARAAMEAAAFVVMLTPFRPVSARTGAMQYADVLLPLAPFTETAGTFVNCEGRWQSFKTAVRPPGEARPGWKILRVLGNRMGQPGFEQSTVWEVRAEIDAGNVVPSAALNKLVLPNELEGEADALTRICEVPIYRVDGLVRRSPALQETADNPPPA